MGIYFGKSANYEKPRERIDKSRGMCYHTTYLLWETNDVER